MLYFYASLEVNIHGTPSCDLAKILIDHNHKQLISSSINNMLEQATWGQEWGVVAGGDCSGRALVH